MVADAVFVARQRLQELGPGTQPAVGLDVAIIAADEAPQQFDVALVQRKGPLALGLESGCYDDKRDFLRIMSHLFMSATHCWYL